MSRDVLETAPDLSRLHHNRSDIPAYAALILETILLPKEVFLMKLLYYFIDSLYFYINWFTYMDTFLSRRVPPSLTVVLLIITAPVLADVTVTPDKIEPKTDNASTEQKQRIDNSSILALSLSGSIAGGWSQQSSVDYAEIWKRNNHMFALSDFGSNSKSTNSQIHALSNDGKTAGGTWKNNNKNLATIWETRSPSWQHVDQTNLKTRKTDGSGESAVNALSRDGSIAGGWSDTDNTEHHATIWIHTAGKKWHDTQGNTINFVGLGTFNKNNKGQSQVNALSGDGLTAGGWADSGKGDTYAHHAAIWTTTTNNWEAISKLNLGTLKSDGSGESAVNALSKDGSIAGGWSDTDNTEHHAVIWIRNKKQWQKKAVLHPDLENSSTGQSEVSAISGNGMVAGGWADKSNSEKHHAALWTSGDNWTSHLKKDLGIVGQVNALSKDGSIAGGWSENKPGAHRATLWRLKYTTDSISTSSDSTKTADSSTESQSSAPSSLIRAYPIDVLNTQASVAKIASDRFATIEQQRLGLGRLQDGCDITRAGKSCYRLGGGASGIDGATDVYSEASFGHAFSDNLASGVTIANTFSGLGHLPGALKRDGLSPGVGIWARWRTATQNGHWYLRGAAAGTRAKIKRTRSGFSGIEPGTGTSTSTGWSVTTELGRVHEITRTTRFGYYGGLRHSDVHLSGYTETRTPGFPFSWSDATSSRTAAYVGARYRTSFDQVLYWSFGNARYRIAFDKEAFSWGIRAELESDLSYQNPTLKAASEVEELNRTYPSDIAHTRGVLSTDFSYSFSDAAVLSFSPFLEHSATDQTVYGAMLRISADF